MVSLAKINDKKNDSNLPDFHESFLVGKRLLTDEEIRTEMMTKPGKISG